MVACLVSYKSLVVYRIFKDTTVNNFFVKVQVQQLYGKGVQVELEKLRKLYNFNLNNFVIRMLNFLNPNNLLRKLLKFE